MSPALRAVRPQQVLPSRAEPCPARLWGTEMPRGFSAALPPTDLVSGTVTAVAARGTHISFWHWLQLSLRGSSQHVAPYLAGLAVLMALSSSQVCLGKHSKGEGVALPYHLKASSLCLIPFNCSNYPVNRCQLLLLKEMITFAA